MSTPGLAKQKQGAVSGNERVYPFDDGIEVALIDPDGSVRTHD
jgi:hypothetical protein